MFDQLKSPSHCARQHYTPVQDVTGRMTPEPRPLNPSDCHRTILCKGL